MAYKFTLTEVIKEFARIEDKCGYVEVRKKYVVNNWDDLQNLFLSLVDFSEGTLKLEIEKEVIEEEVEE